MKKKEKTPDPRKIIAIILLLVLILTCAGAAIIGLTQTHTEENAIENSIVQVENETSAAADESDIDINDPAITGGAVAMPTDEDFIWTTMYTTTSVNIRIAPSLDALVDITVPVNTEVQVGTLSDEWKDIVTIADENWSYIKYDKATGGIGYIYSQYLSKEKTEIKTTSRSSITRTITKSSAGVLTKSKGVNYYNGHKETWYSQKVLPGGGLKIPGRHVAEDGTIRDSNNYICVASSDYSKGTVVETSLGTGKVYDSGCASGTIDIYTNW